MAYNGVTFITSFMKICQLVQII